MAVEDKNGETMEDIDTTEVDESNDNGSDDGTSQNNPSQQMVQSNGEKTFTQSEVKRMMTREKRQGRQAVYNELGIKNGDKKAIEMVKAFIASQNGQDEDGSGDEGAEKLAEAEHRAAVAEAKAEAMMLGVKSQFVDDVVTLALAKIDSDGVEDGEGDFKTVIGDLKTKYPAWFGGAEDEKNSVGKKGTGSSVKPDPTGKNSKQEESIGRRLAAQRKPKRAKSSYWGNH